MEEGYKHNIKWIYFQRDYEKLELSMHCGAMVNDWQAAGRNPESNSSVCKRSPQHKNEHGQKKQL